MLYGVLGSIIVLVGTYAICFVIPRRTRPIITSLFSPRRSTTTRYPNEFGFSMVNFSSQSWSCSSNFGGVFPCPVISVFHSITTRGVFTGSNIEFHATSNGDPHITTSFRADIFVKPEGWRTPPSIRICEHVFIADLDETSGIRNSMTKIFTQSCSLPRQVEVESQRPNEFVAN